MLHRLVLHRHFRTTYQQKPMISHNMCDIKRLMSIGWLVYFDIPYDPVTYSVLDIEKVTLSTMLIKFQNTMG